MDSAAASSRPELTPAARELIEYIAERSHAQTLPEELPRVHVSLVSSSIAKLYEQLRNVIDSTEQHLLRRNAIFRFLKRHVLVYGTRRSIGELLIRELVRSGYVLNDTFPEQDIAVFDATIEKYLRFGEELRARLPHERTGELERWALGLCAAELEQKLYCPDREEALLRFAFEELKQRIRWEDESIHPDERDLQLYIALHRALFKSDPLLVEYHLLASYKPGWNQLTAAHAVEMAEHAVTFRRDLKQHIDHPMGLRLAQQVRRMTIPLKTLLDTAKAHPEDAVERLTVVKTYIKATAETVEGYYKENRRALRRSTVRSLFFIFLTKMALALVLEAPYDLAVTGEIRYLPLGINTLFHPVYLFALATLVRKPGKDNTKRILTDLRATIIQGKTAQPYFVRLQYRRRGAGQLALYLAYLITFVATFGLIIFGLFAFDFGVLGGILFLFFFSLVTFVGIRLRSRARTYFMVAPRESVGSAFFRFMTNPLLEVGRWFSTKFSRYNLFLFVFDIILEAPLKAIAYGIEEWSSFARERTAELE
jgi:hypothetical protein